MIDIVSNPDKATWGDFVYTHPQGNIFQTPEMAEVYKNTKNYLPITLGAIDSHSDEIMSLVSATIINEFGGPLYHDNPKGRESVRLLMKHYDTIAGRSALYTEIRNLRDTNNSPFPQDYLYEEHLNFLVELSAGKEKLWKNLSKSRRYGITKSSKMGITIHNISSENELETLYFLLKDTYSRARHPIADKSLFNAVYTHLVPKNLGKIFFANLENNSIGAIILLLYKQNIYHWYSCSLNEYSKFYPNDILVWHALEWGSLNNYSIFDFMGAGKPEQRYGVREFKRQFGGAMVNYGRYTKIHSPIKYWIAQQGHATYKRVGKFIQNDQVHE